LLKLFLGGLFLGGSGFEGFISVSFVFSKSLPMSKSEVTNVPDNKEWSGIDLGGINPNKLMISVTRIVFISVQLYRFVLDRTNSLAQNSHLLIQKYNYCIQGLSGHLILKIFYLLEMCGNTLLTFSEFTNYRHLPDDMCRIFDVNRLKYRELENKDKIEAYFASDKNLVNNVKIAGPATVIEGNRIIYTCEKLGCILPCLCKDCVLGSEQCNEHKILHQSLFDPSEDLYIVRKADSFNINCNTGNI
jgi:hypothetical protein